MREIVDQTELMEDDIKRVTIYIIYNEFSEVIKFTHKTTSKNGIYSSHEIIQQVVHTLPAVDMSKFKIV